MTLLTSLRRRVFTVATLATLSLGLVHAAHAVDGSAPDQLIRGLSIEVIETVKSDKDIQAGNINKIIALVDAKVMPHVNFQRMTASAVGRFWRQATPDQQAKLQAEFKTLLVRTYAGALTQVKDQHHRPEAAACPAERHRSGRAHGNPRQGRRHPARLPPGERPAPSGRSMTSMCLASGWQNSTETALRRRSASMASMA